MNGELLQMMQLVVTANHYLKTGEFIDCVSYAHVGSLDFIVERRLFGFWKSKKTLNSVKEWTQWLRSNQVREIFLLLGWRDGDRIRSAFANGVDQWEIVCCFKDYVMMWETWIQFNENQQNWKYIYQANHIEVANSESPPMENNLTVLIGALKEIELLAEKLELVAFARCFSNAWRILEGESIAPTYEVDWHGLLDQERKSIFEALTWAWVFGGMGSWNDGISFAAEEKGLKEEYDLLSGTLYQEILKALIYCSKG